MSFYGSSNQGSVPSAPGQRPSGPPHSIQSNQSGAVELPSQMFNFTPGQLQFQPGSHNISFSDPGGTSIQMQNIQLGAGAPQLLLQQQQQSFPNLNVNFLTEQMGVSQIIQPPGANQAQSISMQNILTPMSVALTGVNFAQATTIQASSGTSQSSQQAKQRVFTGTVTKTHDNFGFIDEEVFFQMSVVKGVVLPKPGDRVLVEADFNPAMPFKWNATRVQIVNIGGLNNSLSNMNLNPGGKPQSPQPMQHGSQSANAMAMSQHSNPASTANLLNMNYSQQNLGNNQKNNQSQNPANVLSASAHNQGPQQSQGNSRYQSATNPVSIVSNPHSAYGVRNNARQDDNSRVHPGARSQRVRPPPPPVSVPPPPSMGSLASMDSHSVQHMQLPLPMQMPLTGPLQLPSLLQMDRDLEKRKAEREKEHDRRERERERERERSLEREKEREKEREREYDRKRERERERDREKQKRLKEDGKRDREKEWDKSPSRPARGRSPAPVTRESRKRSRSQSKGRDKEKENRDRSKSRSLTPKPQAVRERPVARYSWEVPRTALDLIDLNVMELKRRYRNLYIPSDFILAKACWQDTFPLHQALDLTHSAPIHIFRRYNEKIELAEMALRGKALHLDVIPAPASHTDENDSLKVKVILLCLPSKASLYRKACGLSEDLADTTLQHPSRLINFVVGTKIAKNETMIVGGSWSPTLDGPNPESDNQVLINTAIRTTKALTGIDLRRCTKWYRFMELYYRRGNGNIETVVVFLPNLVAALPSRREWEEIQKSYKDTLCLDKDKNLAETRKGKEKSGSPDTSESLNVSEKASGPPPTPGTALPVPGTGDGDPGDKETKVEDNLHVSLKSENLLEAMETYPNQRCDSPETLKKSEDTDIYSDLISLPISVMDDSVDNVEGADECPEELNVAMENVENIIEEKTSEGEVVNNNVAGGKCDNSHNGAAVEIDTVESILPNSRHVDDKTINVVSVDPKQMTVLKLREELESRGASTKGLKKNQLVTRLTKILKEQETTEGCTEMGKSLDQSNTLILVNPTEEDSGVESTCNGYESEGRTNVVIKLETDTKNLGAEDASRGHSLPVNSDDTGRPVIGNQSNEEQIKSNHCGPSDTVKMETGRPATMQMRKKCELTFKVPLLTEETSEKTKKVWERRYSLPKTPHLLLHPSQEAKSGTFDCTQHSLHTLRDYRLSDNKEQSFEVSLCSEFFHEMLQRDFAFRIYRELVYQANIHEEREDKIPTVTGSKEESPAKKRKVSASSNVSTASKSKTMDPYLLLAFVFFDQTRCGYVADTDLEDLCLSLGLGLSRSHIRKLTQKVCTKGNLHYKKWTDVTGDDCTVGEQQSREENNELNLITLAQGVKCFIPMYGKPKQSLSIQDVIFSSGDGENLTKETQSLLAACDSDLSIVDAKRLRDQLEKSEKDRSTLDLSIKHLKSMMDETKCQAVELKKFNDTLKEELKRTKEIVKKFETNESTAMAELDILRKASERFIDRVKDVLQIPVIASKEKESKNKGKDVPKKEAKEDAGKNPVDV